MIVTQGTATKRGTACQTCQGCESEKSSKEMATESLNPPPADCPIGSTIPRATEPLDRRLQPCCYLRLSSPYFWWMISLQVLDEL